MREKSGAKCPSLIRLDVLLSSQGNTEAPAHRRGAALPRGHCQQDRPCLSAPAPQKRPLSSVSCNSDKSTRRRLSAIRRVFRAREPELRMSDGLSAVAFVQCSRITETFILSLQRCQGMAPGSTLIISYHRRSKYLMKVFSLLVPDVTVSL